MEYSTKIEVYVKSIKKTYGLFDHYYIVIGDYEYHLGYYKKGSILPIGSTKNSKLLEIKTICSLCYEKFLHDFSSNEFQRLFIFYPFVNCESLTTGISTQMICVLNFFIPITFCVLGLYMRAFLSLILIIITTIITKQIKYMKTTIKHCPHLIF